MTPDLEKRKKGWRAECIHGCTSRSEHHRRITYENLNKPSHPPTPYLSDDDDQADNVAQPDVGKRKFSQSRRRRLAREGKALPDGSYPIETPEDLHNAAVLARSGHGDVEGAKRLIARRAREMNMKDPFAAADKSMIGNPFQPGARSVTDRLSPSRVSGQAAASSGDHNARVFHDPMAQPGPRELAYGHPDMRQSNTRFNDVVARLRTANADGNGDRNITWTAGEVGLSLFDAASAAGRPPSMQPVAWSPFHPADHQSRGSAVPPTPGHPLTNPVSHTGAPGAMKASEAREMLKRHMFPGSRRG